MPENTDLPPVLQRLGDDLAVAMQSAIAVRPHVRLLRTIASLPRRAPKRSAALAVVALAAVVALLVVPSLDGSRTAVAQAAVLTRAAAALDQPNTILYIQVHDYSADGDGISMLGGNELGGFAMCVPGPCSHSGTPATLQTGISADPSGDTLTYSSQEWLSPGQDHTIYNNGDEVATSDATDQYVAYDAADNTLTTLTDMGFPSTPTSSPPSNLALAAAPGAISSNLAGPLLLRTALPAGPGGTASNHSGGQRADHGRSTSHRPDDHRRRVGLRVALRRADHDAVGPRSHRSQLRADGMHP